MTVAAERFEGLAVNKGRFTSPEQVVSHLVAVQSQDYLGASWGIGLRASGVDSRAVDEAFDAGAILRTHVLRPTWHFATPDDIGWLLELTAPKVQQVSGTMYRQLGLEPTTLLRSDEVIAAALEGGRFLTRDELKPVLRLAGLPVDARMQMTYLMAHAELTRTVISGPRKGKQFSYALFSERAPRARRLEREEALAELALRYFTSRGPANERDLSRWSQLSLTDARKGLAAIADRLERIDIDGVAHWRKPGPEATPEPSPTIHLLSVYDEYLASYKTWDKVVDAEIGKTLVALENALTHVIVLDGRLVGSWRRVFKKERVVIEARPLVRLGARQRRALEQAAERYGAFFGVTAELLV